MRQLWRSLAAAQTALAEGTGPPELEAYAARYAQGARNLKLSRACGLAPTPS